MALALPSKKVQALFIIILSLFVSYFLYRINIRERILAAITGASSHGSLQAVDSVDMVNSDLDTDKDGLKDWQEVLWKTDKEKTDTDGDGTPDGQEVIDGRDPVIAGPNDTLPQTRGVTQSDADALSASINDDPDNLSTTVSRALFAQFMSLDATGGSQQDIVNGALAGIQMKAILPAYTTADIKVVNTDVISLRTYGNNLAQAITKYNATAGSYANDKFALATYEEMIDTMKSTPVPSSVALFHLQLLNTHDAMRQTLENIVNYKTDPVKGLLSIQAATQLGDQVFEINGNIAAEFKKNGIIFNQNEPGYIWNN